MTTVSLSLRWRVAPEDAKEFKKDLIDRDLSTQDLMETFVAAYTQLPKRTKDRFVEQIHSTGPRGAGQWLSDQATVGVEMTRGL